MSSLLVEGNLQFDFSGCKPCKPAEKFDEMQSNPYGMGAVDFVVETTDTLYFIEVKDFQNPRAKSERKREDAKMLSAAIEKKDAIFPIKMGQKLKDSLLRKYAQGEKISKKVVYLLLINFDKFTPHERGLLEVKISGHIPTGLNNCRFSEFTNVHFEIVDVHKMLTYGINCTPIV